MKALVTGGGGFIVSNLVDALRWVLGEQSAKRLRGNGMEDVIFNGTSSGRGPAGMAEVSLLLENEEVLDLKDSTGHAIARFRWTPKRPGAEIMRTVLPFEFFIFTMLIYFVVCYSIVRASRIIERKMALAHR